MAYAWHTALLPMQCGSCPDIVLIPKGGRVFIVELAGVTPKLFLCESCGQRFERRQQAAEQERVEAAERAARLALDTGGKIDDAEGTETVDP
jgi:hypothetical protein